MRKRVSFSWRRTPIWCARGARQSSIPTLQIDLYLTKSGQPLLALGGLGDTPPRAIKRAMNVLGVPISPTVRGPALTFGEGAHEDAEAILEGSGLGTHK
jgi:hypothetical protein